MDVIATECRALQSSNLRVIQANRKRLEGRQFSDRNEQFQHIYRKVQEFKDAG